MPTRRRARLQRGSPRRVEPRPAKRGRHSLVSLASAIPCELLRLIACNLWATDVVHLLIVCKAFSLMRCLADKEVTPCTAEGLQAIMGSKCGEEINEAIEYVASRELRLGPCNCERFDEMCTRRYVEDRKLGCVWSLDQLLEMWEYMEPAPDLQHGQPHVASRTNLRQNALRIPALVARRYLCAGTVLSGPASVLQRRRAAGQLVQLARSKLEHGHVDSAAACLLEAIAMKPDHVQANYTLGNLFLRGTGVVQDERRAVELLSLASEHGHWQASMELGEHHAERDRLAEAQAAFERAGVAPYTFPADRACAAYNLGIVHQAQGNLGAAEEKFLLSRTEGSLRACYNLGALYWDQGRKRRAKSYLEEALCGELAAKALCVLGQYYAEHRCFKKAQAFLERSLAGGEPLAAVHLNRLRREGRGTPKDL